MKTFNLPLLVLLAFALFTYSGCEDDDGAGNTVADSLQYDGANVTAPFNGEGFNTFAVYFPPQETQAYVGRRLDQVSFFLEDLPTETVVIIYAEGTDDRTPGAERYSINLTTRIRNTGWYDHVITDPDADVEIRENEGIWLAVEVDAPVNQFQAIGCDNGANYNPNGDRFLPPTGNTWTSFNEITGTERINWNIRGFLAE